MPDLTEELRDLLAETRDALVCERARRSGDTRNEYAQMLSDADMQLAAARAEIKTLRRQQTENARLYDTSETPEEGEERPDFTEETAIHRLENRNATG